MYVRLLGLFLALLLGACDLTRLPDEADATEDDSTAVPTDPVIPPPPGPVTVTASFLVGDSVAASITRSILPIALDSAWSVPVPEEVFAYSVENRPQGHPFAFFFETCDGEPRPEAAFVLFATEDSEPIRESDSPRPAQKNAQADLACRIHVFAIRGFGGPLPEVGRVGRNNDDYAVPIQEYALSGTPAVTTDDLVHLGELAHQVNGRIRISIEASARKIHPMVVYRSKGLYQDWNAEVSAGPLELGYGPDAYEGYHYFVFLLDLTTAG